MAQDALLTLADDQSLASGWSGATGTTGFQLTEHTVNLGARQDAFNGVQFFAVITIKSTLTFAAGTDSVFFEVKASETSTAFTNVATQELRPTLGKSVRLFAADVTKGKQIVIALSPQSTNNGNVVNTPLGWPVIYGLVIGQDVSLAAVSLTGGTFDMELRADNPRGQKYYPQATSVG